MTIEISFLTAVVLAGLASVVGQLLVHRIPFLQREYIPAPALGGLLVAFTFLALRAFDVIITVPTSGRPMDFLVGLLTTNMGLHIAPRLVRNDLLLFPAFLAMGIVLYFAQFLLALPLTIPGGHGLAKAALIGPVSFVGAPFNLNPPSQIDPIRSYFVPGIPNPQDLAQASMMIGVVTSVFLTGVVGRRLLRRANGEPPKKSPTQKGSSGTIWSFGNTEFFIILTILGIIALAFGIQDLLGRTFDWFKVGYLPVIVISYLLGATARLLFGALIGDKHFPKQELNALLFGPTMSFVLAYAVMSIPLHKLSHLGLTDVIVAPFAVAASVAVAWLAFSVLARITDRYDAAVVSTVFLAVTTAWGPVAMSYLRQYAEEEGPAQPVPIALPLNAFYVFPWMASLLTMLILK